MPFVEGALDTLADGISAYLAPFQPQVLPDYPNTDPRAGSIVATYVAPGHPVQIDMNERLEAHGAVVCMFAGKVNKREPYVNDFNPGNTNWVETSPGPPAQYAAFLEITRDNHEVLIQVWATTYEARAAISNLISQMLGDHFRQTELDGTVTVIRYTNTVPFDDEQNDSIYVDQIHVMADYTITAPLEATQVIETTVTLELESAGQTGSPIVITTP